MKFAPKLTALFISIGAIIAAVMFTIAYFQVAKMLEGEVRARMENRVFFIMDAMDRFLYERLSDISVISHDPVISSGNATAEQITERLIFFRNAYKCYVSLSFFNLERIRIADTAGMNIGEQNQMTRYWEDILSGKVSAASDVHISKDFQVPIAHFASAVNNKEGRAIGVVVARIPTSRLFEMIKGGAGIQEEEGEEIDLINKDGFLIYSNHNREGILKENLPEWESIKIAQREKIFGSAKYRNPDEKEAEIHAFCREQGHLDFKGNGWIVISNVPTRVIFGPANKLLKILIIMFLAMLPVLALVIYLFSKTVSLPLTRLSFAAAEIGKGKLDTVIEVESKDEIGSLANTFNQMAADLKKTTISIDNLNKEITERKKAEEALRDSEGRFRTIFEEVTDGILLADAETKKFYFGNKTIYKMLGYNEKEISSFGVMDIHPQKDLPYVLEQFEKQRRREIALAKDMPVKRKDGSVFYADINSASITLAGRTYVMGIFRDITERKKAEEELKASETKYRTLLENLPQRIFYKDRKSVYVSCNDSYAQDLKIKSDEIVGKTDYEFYPKELAEKYIADDKRIMGSGKTAEIEEKYIQEGREFVVNTIKTPVKDTQGNVIGILGIFWDITEKKKAEEALKEYTKKIEQINKELDDFTYIVSHDLKEPLRSIDAFSKFLEDDYKEKLSEDGRGYIERIRANTTRMQSLIEDLLEISRIERKRSSLEEVDAEGLLGEVKLRLEYAIKEKNAEIVVQDNLPRIFCDRVRLVEVFANLFSNAIKFNDKPDPRIEVGYAERDDYHEFYVKDNGPGIEQQYYEKIFEIFQRLGKREDAEGTGAGLTIVRKIIEIHRGKIWVDSKVGEYTTFYFTIPKRKQDIAGKKKLGEILVENKLVTEEELKKALKEQEETG
jgi:hypothetical protein